MLISIPSKYSVSQIMGYLKGKSSLMTFDRHADLKNKYGNRSFWCEGYYVDTVGRNKKVIEKYIRNQLQEDIASDQMTLKECIGIPRHRNRPRKLRPVKTLRLENLLMSLWVQLV